MLDFVTQLYFSIIWLYHKFCQAISKSQEKHLVIIAFVSS